MLCLYWKNTWATLLMGAGNAFSSQYSLYRWLHHYQGGNISQKNRANKNVHCTQSASFSRHSIWRSSVHSLVLCHPLIYSSRVRETLFSDSLWRMTPLETAFSLSADTAYSTRAELIRERQRALAPRGLTFKNEIGQHTVVDLLILGLCCLLVVRDA